MVDRASRWLVVDDHRPGGDRPAVSPSTRFYQGIYGHKIIPLPVLPVSWLDPSNRHSSPANVQHVISSSGSHTCFTSVDRIDPADNTIKWPSLHRATRWRPIRR